MKHAVIMQSINFMIGMIKINRTMNIEEFINKNNLYAESFENIADTYIKYLKDTEGDDKELLKVYFMAKISIYADHNKELFIIAGNKEV